MNFNCFKEPEEISEKKWFWIIFRCFYYEHSETIECYFKYLFELCESLNKKNSKFIFYEVNKIPYKGNKHTTKNRFFNKCFIS